MAFPAWSRIVKSAVMALFLLWPSLVAAQAADDMKFPSELLTIVSAGGKKHQFLVELATTGPQRERGLMYRRQMDGDAGMLFDFGVSRPVMMWMKNTELSLDMLFISNTGVIRKVHREAVPMSETIISSQSSVKYVLEINGGRAAALGIREGDRVYSPQIGNAN